MVKHHTQSLGTSSKTVSKLNYWKQVKVEVVVLRPHLIPGKLCSCTFVNDFAKYSNTTRDMKKKVAAAGAHPLIVDVKSGVLKRMLEHSQLVLFETLR